MRDFGMGGIRWLGQFAVGLPITGEFPQKFLYPADPPTNKRISTGALYDTAGSRFRERAAKSGHKNAQLLWGEAMGQVQKGGLFPPAELAPNGRPLSWRSSDFNIAFRFGAPQQEKLRACDDLKHSTTNMACFIPTPIQLLSWGRISQLSQLMAKHKGDWVLFKADHEAAYKQLPTLPSDMRNAIIALRHPTKGTWRGFVTRTLIFGSAADVLRYNVFSRILAELCIRCLGIPLVIYFDDFAAIIHAQLGPGALRIFTAFCKALCITLKPGKSSVAGKIVFLGMLGDFPSDSNNRLLSISLPPEKRAKWSQLIAGYLKEGRISHS